MSNVSQKPMITTIIPTYRRPRLLRRAIRSVLNQTYPHFQVCVYDNASGDETASVVAEMAKADHRVKYHCHPENIGAHKNFVYGMEHVETPFFSFLSDDDVLLPEFYQTAMAGFEKFPDVIFSAGATIRMTDKGNVCSITLASWEKDGYYTPPNGLLKMLEKGIPTWTAILFRKEVIEKVGVLDKDVGAPADNDFELRIAAHFPFVISHKPCAIWMVHSLSYCASSSIDFHFVWPGWLKMIRNLTEDEGIPLDVRIRAERILTEQIKRRLYNFGIKAIKQKNFEDAYKLAGIFNNHYHQKTKAFFLYTIAKACKYLPSVYYLLSFLNLFRKLFYNSYRWYKNRHLQKQFGDYAKFLN